ncbi:MAG: hypothetical protein QOH06_1461 [Acidobacteriota bacterium]|jgi:hypothetical protein|nr:hypothetical protein [Acidobacteriota bacterium]
MERAKLSPSRGEWIVVALACAIAHAFYWRAALQPPAWDAKSYLEIAAEIADKGLFTRFHYSELRTYGYPWLLSGLLRLARATGTQIGLLIFEAQLALHLGAALFARRALTGRALGLSPGLCQLVFAALTLNVFVLSYTAEILSESISLSLITLGAAFWLRQLQIQGGKEWWINLFLGSLAAGFSVMVRPANVFFLAAWIVAVTALFVTRRVPIRRIVPAAAVLLAGLALPMLPQLANNIRHYDRATPLVAAPLAKSQQAWGIRSQKYATAFPPALGPAIHYANPLSAGTVLDEGRPLAWYLEHPVAGTLTLTLHVFNMLDQDLLFTYSHDLDPWYRIPVGILNHGLIALALAGFVLIVRRRKQGRDLGLAALVLLAYAAFHIAVHAPTLVEMRFGLPLLLVAAPLAAWAVSEIRGLPGRARLTAVLWAAAYVAAALVLSGWVRHQSIPIRLWESAEGANLPLLVLLSLAVYGGTAAAALYAAHRWVRPLQRKIAVLLALAPLLLTGPATFRGAVYAPLDINFIFEPLTAYRAEAGLTWVQTPLLSDVAFSMIPWQKAVREHFRNGRAPLWNRFVLAGEPLLAVQQSGALHPFTWVGFLLPLAQSWTFQMSARLFLAVLCAYLLFRDIGCREAAALLGALGWALSDFMVFWLGYTVGNAISPFPLLVLGLTRLVRDADRRAVALTAIALVLITAAGHPESLLFAVTGAGIYFLFLLGFAGPKRRARPLLLSLAAGAIALGLAAVQLAPMFEVLPHTWEQLLRAQHYAHQPKSVAPQESARRAATYLLPYAHGESGHGQLRPGGFGVPGGYAGAILLPLAACGLFGRERIRWAFLAVGLFGLVIWARLGLVTDALTALPLFDIAVTDYLVFLAAFATCALAALGADRLLAGEGRSAFLAGAALAVAGIAALYFVFEPAMRQLDMPQAYLHRRVLLETVPVALGLVFALALFRRASTRMGAVVLLALLAVPRVFEAGGVYPVCSARALSPRLQFLEAIPLGTPVRMLALGEMFVPNVSALYELEDVRGYESMTLLSLVQTFPLWVSPGYWFNRVDNLRKPFLSFLNVGYAIVPLGYHPPPGWKLRSRDKNADLLQNKRVLPRAFAPASVRLETGAGQRIALLGSIRNFRNRGVVASWPGAAPGVWHLNGSARIEITSYQAQSMTIEVDAQEETIVGTSIPAWPGWKARLDGAAIEPLSYNHAFLGFQVPQGAHRLTLRYLPDSFVLGAAVSLLTLAASLVLLLRRARHRSELP